MVPPTAPVRTHVPTAPQHFSVSWSLLLADRDHTGYTELLFLLLSRSTVAVNEANEASGQFLVTVLHVWANIAPSQGTRKRGCWQPRGQSHAEHSWCLSMGCLLVLETVTFLPGPWPFCFPTLWVCLLFPTLGKGRGAGIHVVGELPQLCT